VPHSGGNLSSPFQDWHSDKCWSSGVEVGEGKVVEIPKSSHWQMIKFILKIWVSYDALNFCLFLRIYGHPTSNLSLIALVDDEVGVMTEVPQWK